MPRDFFETTPEQQNVPALSGTRAVLRRRYAMPAIAAKPIASSDPVAGSGGFYAGEECQGIGVVAGSPGPSIDPRGYVRKAAVVPGNRSE
jgi:hypothetical protein